MKTVARRFGRVAYVNERWGRLVREDGLRLMFHRKQTNGFQSLRVGTKVSFLEAMGRARLRGLNKINRVEKRGFVIGDCQNAATDVARRPLGRARGGVGFAAATQHLAALLALDPTTSMRLPM